MNPIVQCVPNISEGRDLSKIEYIVEPLRNQEGFKLISVEPDKDYHRSVITLIGDPKMMIEPLVEFFKRAEEKIDMNVHHGEHARMGAVDVVPFIPISDVTIEECVEYANILAKKVSQALNISVFLYALAATHPSRVNLPDIRKGEFEQMSEKIMQDEWKPDFGPTVMHKTFGVTAIGARIPLIAYNIDLNTEDVKIASSIAKAIRQSSGGFAYIQAGPVLLEERGHVQVTMNILDYKKNPMYRIFETVKMEAKRYHIDVTGSEVVGLCPLDALISSMRYYTSVDDLKFSKTMSIKEIVELSIKYLKLRDFDELKVIEANL
ncbi:MAG: glutamate formimidoyltransferase [Tenericutes bacterium HGW-Tenericutes-3]|nr:MAG: glutamate formimidoyltransferase [Tenericutes bacterium HGW-Tenericutes-3]